MGSKAIAEDEGKLKQVSISMPRAMREFLESEAGRERNSLSSVVRRLVAAYMKKKG